MNKGARKEKKTQKEKKSELSLLAYDVYAVDAKRAFKSKKNKGVSVFEFSPLGSDVHFKIIVCKEEKNEQFFAIEPTNALTKLGEGQSPVYLGINLETGEKVAVKAQIQKSAHLIDSDLQRERNILKDKLELLGTAIEGRIDYTIMKLHRGKNFLEELYEIDSTQEYGSAAYFKAKKNLPYLTKLEYTKSAILAVQNLHKCDGLVHRDIKSANFNAYMMGNLHYLSLLDMGAAIKIKGDLENVAAGSLGYLPPECSKNKNERPYNDPNYDKWSLGIVLREIWSEKNFQAFLLNLSWEQSKDLTAEQIKEFLGTPTFENEQEKVGLENIFWIITQLTAEKPERRLALETGLNILNKLFATSVKDELEQMIIPKEVKSSSQINEFNKKKIEDFRERRISQSQEDLQNQKLNNSNASSPRKAPRFPRSKSQLEIKKSLIFSSSGSTAHLHSEQKKAECSVEKVTEWIADLKITEQKITEEKITEEKITDTAQEIIDQKITDSVLPTTIEIIQPIEKDKTILNSLALLLEDEKEENQQDEVLEKLISSLSTPLFIVQAKAARDAKRRESQEEETQTLVQMAQTVRNEADLILETYKSFPIKNKL